MNSTTEQLVLKVGCCWDPRCPFGGASLGLGFRVSKNLVCS